MKRAVSWADSKVAYLAETMVVPLDVNWAVEKAVQRADCLADSWVAASVG